jgi:hypothetical protein
MFSVRLYHTGDGSTIRRPTRVWIGTGWFFVEVARAPANTDKRVAQRTQSSNTPAATNQNSPSADQGSVAPDASATGHAPRAGTSDVAVIDVVADTIFRHSAILGSPGELLFAQRKASVRDKFLSSPNHHTLATKRRLRCSVREQLANMTAQPPGCILPP